MEDSKSNPSKQPKISDLDIVNHARELAHKLKLRAGIASKFVAMVEQPTQQQICDALFDVAQATQKALIANNCAGV